MTVIGTITHEMGHYSVARILGYKAQINYASCIYWDEEDEAYFREVGKKYPNEIIPKAQLLTFLSSGLIGGVAGYYLWIIKFGSVIMP